MREENPRLTVSVEEGVTVVQLADRKILDEMSIMQIGEQLNALIAEAETPKLVLDFTHVGHMSSSALGMLITLHKRIRQRDGELRLCCIQPTIYEVFVITRLNEIFQICQTREEALAGPH
jgi:anti-anti-sigma factor